MFRGTIVLLIALLIPALLRADDAPPATSSVTTAPTQPAPLNQETPKGALKLLTKSMEAGEGETISAVLGFSSPAERETARVISEGAVAMFKLRKAAVAAFGQEKSKELTGDPGAAAAALIRIDAAGEKVDGDTAMISEGTGRGIKLVRADGKWKVPASEFLVKVKPEELQDRLDTAALETKVVGDVADDIVAGKLKSAEDASQALRNRMTKAAVDQHRVTTKPSTTSATTAPASGPAK